MPVCFRKKLELRQIFWANEKTATLESTSYANVPSIPWSRVV